ncbi:MAG TPA: hypothetical protein VGI84_05855 [Pseudonocardiaceae bacterium]
MQSLLDLFLSLLGGDEELMKAYQADPQGFAAQHFGDLCDADWRDLNHALGHSGAVERAPEAGAGGADGPAPDGPAPESSHGSSDSPTAGAGGSDEAGSGSGSSGHHWEDSEHAIAQLHNIVNNFTQVEDHHVENDMSTIQKINTGGGDFWQRIDNDANIVSGNGAVGAGHDIESPVNTGELDKSDHSSDVYVIGDGNLVGDHNKGNIVGDENEVGNDESSHTVAVGGDLAGGDIDKSTENQADGSFNGWFNGNEDSFNDHSISHSFNDNFSDNFSHNFSHNTEPVDNNTVVVPGAPTAPALSEPSFASTTPDLSLPSFGALSPAPSFGALSPAPSFGALSPALSAPTTDATAPGSFNDNTVTDSFNNNNVTDSFNGHDLSGSFNGNDVSNSFNNNDVTGSFNHSATDATASDTAADSSLHDSTSDNSFNDNTVTDSFNHQSLTDASTTSNSPLDEMLSHNNVPVDVTLPAGF